MPAAATATPERIREVNERYHDAAAASYDSKWGIDFGEVGRGQTRQKLAKALGGWPDPPFASGLEIGSGTGYFSLNLMQQGALGELTATDVSCGMLDTLSATAARLGLAERVRVEQADAESLPFADGSFDLVFGHAVLHHIPDLDTAFGEFLRVLRPGGAIVFCGEPTEHGDRLAAVPKRLGALAAPTWRRVLNACPRRGHEAADAHDHGLEGEVDVHAFDAHGLETTIERAGFADVRIRGEELVANMYGWWLRSLEATADPPTIPDRWKTFAFHSYLALQRIDVALLEPRLPAALFYNLVLSARKPA